MVGKPSDTPGETLCDRTGHDKAREVRATERAKAGTEAATKAEPTEPEKEADPDAAKKAAMAAKKQKHEAEAAANKANHEAKKKEGLVEKARGLLRGPSGE
jgi:hypothetical protein